MTTVANIEDRAGAPKFNVTELRNAFGTFATGVTVVTAAAGEIKTGVTVNSFSSLSLNPPLVLWALNLNSASLRTFRIAERFAVNVLSSNQSDLASRFAKSRGPKLNETDWFYSDLGIPLIQGVSAVFECRRVTEYQGGDHVIFIGEVEKFSCNASDVLVFARGRYSLVVDYPSAVIPQAHPDAIVDNDFIMPALLEAFRSLSQDFAKDRRPGGLSMTEALVLLSLLGTSGLSQDVIEHATLLTPTKVSDTLNFLRVQHLVKDVPNGLIVLTLEGSETAQKFLGAIHEFERARLAGIDSKDIETTRAVLKRINFNVERKKALAGGQPV
jgi:flavin reductase (DIM6/NTAB) family NADH-FMN oxidoreductase RutF/DNA-binding MarR family transcriptional regulator